MKKILSFGLVICLSIFFQTAFILVESIETPQKVVTAFCKSFYQLDDSAIDYLTENAYMADDINMIKLYKEKIQKQTNACGYRMSYAKNFLFKIETHTINQNAEEATIQLKAKKTAIIPWLRYRKLTPIDHTFRLVKENGHWKINSSIDQLL